MRISSSFIAVAVVAIVLAGCAGSSHLTESHGRSYHAFLTKQRAPSKVPFQEAVKGLDSEESAIIAKSYRTSLGTKETREAGEDQILLVAPPQRAGGGRVAPLAPSVPQER